MQLYLTVQFSLNTRLELLLLSRMLLLVIASKRDYESMIKRFKRQTGVMEGI